MRDAIELTDFEFDTIIGILDAEQRLPQPVAMDLRMELPIGETAATGRLDHSINYADVQQWILTLAQQGRWRLLESLAEAAARLLLAEPAPCEARGRIGAVELRIRKPTILQGAVPGVAIRRESDWCDLREEPVAYGVVVGRLGETPVQGAWRVVLDPGARWTVPAGQSLLVLAGGGAVVEEGAGTRTIGHGDAIARAPGRSVTAGPTGLALLAVGSPARGEAG